MKQIFESERISFVELSEDLVKDYLVMINDFENVQRFIRRASVQREPLTEEQEIAWVRKNLNEKSLAFSMLEKASGEFIGNAQFVHRNGDEAELGIAITANKQNMGYGTEAVAAIVSYGMERVGLKRIYLLVNPANARALHVYAKGGFREYDRNEEHVFMEITKQ